MNATVLLLLAILAIYQGWRRGIWPVAIGFLLGLAVTSGLLFTTGHATLNGLDSLVSVLNTILNSKTK